MKIIAWIKILFLQNCKIQLDNNFQLLGKSDLSLVDNNEWWKRAKLTFKLLLSQHFSSLYRSRFGFYVDFELEKIWLGSVKNKAKLHKTIENYSTVIPLHFTLWKFSLTPSFNIRKSAPCHVCLENPNESFEKIWNWCLLLQLRLCSSPVTKTVPDGIFCKTSFHLHLM